MELGRPEYLAGGLLGVLAAAAMLTALALAAHNEGIHLPVTKFLRESGKAVIAFFGVFVTVLLARLSTGDSALPALDDLPGWLALIGGCFGTALLTYLKRNAQTPKQVTHGFNALDEHDQRQVVQAIGPGPYA